VVSQSRYSPASTEPRVSLACSQQPETNPCGKPVKSSPHRDDLRSILILSSHSCLSVANGVFLPRFQTHYFPRVWAVIVLQLTFDFFRRSVCAETRCLAGVALLHSEVHHPDRLHPQAGSSALIVDAAGPCNSESVWRCRYPHVCSVMGGCANPSHPISAAQGIHFAYVQYPVLAHTNPLNILTSRTDFN